MIMTDLEAPAKPKVETEAIHSSYYLGRRIYIKDWGMAQVVAFNGVSYIFAVLLDFRVDYREKNTYGIFTVPKDKIQYALLLPDRLTLSHDDP